jgi:hypothetical protein
MDRAGLINEIIAGRARLEAAVARLTPAQMIETDFPGGWSMKDLLAHLGWWEQRSIEIYRDLAKGEHPARPISSDDVDAVNAQILEQFRSKSLDEVVKFELAAYREVLQLVETAPEADLFDSQRFSAWTKGEPFMEWILGNSSGHYEEHWSSIQDKLARDAQV